MRGQSTWATFFERPIFIIDDKADVISEAESGRTRRPSRFIIAIAIVKSDYHRRAITPLHVIRAIESTDTRVLNESQGATSDHRADVTGDFPGGEEGAYSLARAYIRSRTCMHGENMRYWPTYCDRQSARERRGAARRDGGDPPAIGDVIERVSTPAMPSSRV